MKSLLLTLASFCSLPLLAQQPPPAEYPYPETTIQQTSTQVEKPARVDETGAYYYNTEKKSEKKAPFKGVEQPTKIGDDGSYYYGEEHKEEEPQIPEGVEKPIDSDADGGYYYSPKKEKSKPKERYGSTPSEITKDGAYLYDIKKSTTTNAFSFRFGSFAAPKIKPKEAGGLGYSNVYGESSTFLFSFDYSWKIWDELHFKIGSGVTFTNGKGQFAGGANPGIAPKESYQLYIFPNTATLAYHFRIWDSQIFTPYAEGGLGYFGMLEYRSDGKSTKFGGAPTMIAAGGLLISLNALQSGTALLTEYGIQNTWLDLQFKQVVGLDERKDFSTNMITGGFAFDF